MINKMIKTSFDLNMEVWEASESMMKEIGCSGILLSASNNVLAGIAILPLSEASTFMLVVMVVSISLANNVNVSLFNSNRKQSKIGIVLLEFKTPLIDFKCFSNVDDDTIKFIVIYLSLKFTDMLRVNARFISVLINYFLTTGLERLLSINQ